MSTNLSKHITYNRNNMVVSLVQETNNGKNPNFCFKRLVNFKLCCEIKQCISYSVPKKTDKRTFVWLAFTDMIAQQLGGHIQFLE